MSKLSISNDRIMKHLDTATEFLAWSFREQILYYRDNIKKLDLQKIIDLRMKLFLLVDLKEFYITYLEKGWLCDDELNQTYRVLDSSFISFYKGDMKKFIDGLLLD